jgi:hypothetical protein
VERRLAGVDRDRLVPQVLGGERVEEIVRQPSGPAARERGAQRTPDACERLVGARPDGGQRLEPALLDGYVVLDEREHLRVAGGQRPVPRHGRAVRADPLDGWVRRARPIERGQARAEVGGGTGDDGDCGPARNHAAAG